MGDTLRQGEAESTCCPALTGEALEQAVPLAPLTAVLQPQGVQPHRERTLPMVVTGWGIRALKLDAPLSSGHGMRQLARGLRWHRARPPTTGGPQPAPARIGARHGGHGHGRPGAADGVAPGPRPTRPGAWRCGRRLMAMEGPGAALPDTPANVAVFGRHHRDRGQAALPHLQSVSRAACGPPAMGEAGCGPRHTCERLGGWRGARSVTNDRGAGAFWSRFFESG